MLAAINDNLLEIGVDVKTLETVREPFLSCWRLASRKHRWLTNVGKLELSRLLPRPT